MHVILQMCDCLCTSSWWWLWKILVHQNLCTIVYPWCKFERISGKLLSLVERWLIHYGCSYPVFAAVFFPETSASRWCHFSMTVVCCLLLQHLGWRWLHACKLEQLPRHVCHYVVWIQIHIMLTYFIDTKYSTLFLLFCIEWSPLACNIFVNLSFQ